MAATWLIDHDEAPRVRWYRYEDVRYASSLDEWERPVGEGSSGMHLSEFPVLRETPCGVWLEGAGIYGGNRFVLRDARKRYACPTTAEALASFQARKERQKRILSAQLRHVERCLLLAAEEWKQVDAETVAPAADSPLSTLETLLPC